MIEMHNIYYLTAVLIEEELEVNCVPGSRGDVDPVCSTSVSEGPKIDNSGFLCALTLAL